MSPAEDVELRYLGANVWMRVRQIAQDTFRPVLPWRVMQLLAHIFFRLASQRPVVGQHGRPLMAAQALVGGVDVTQRRAVENDIVP